MNEEPKSIDEVESNESYRIYERRYDQLTQRASSNNENRDKTVVTVSGAVLALTVAYLRLVEGDVVWAPCLYIGWILFFIAIALTVISLHTGNKAIDVGLVQDFEFYVMGNDEGNGNVWERYNNRINISSSGCFLIGLLVILIFLFRNGSGAPEADLPNQEAVLDNTTVRITGAAQIVINGDVAMPVPQKKAGSLPSSKKSQGAGKRQQPPKQQPPNTTESNSSQSSSTSTED